MVVAGRDDLARLLGPRRACGDGVPVSRATPRRFPAHEVPCVLLPVRSGAEHVGGACLPAEERIA